MNIQLVKRGAVILVVSLCVGIGAWTMAEKHGGIVLAEGRFDRRTMTTVGYSSIEAKWLYMAASVGVAIGGSMLLVGLLSPGDGIRKS